jgi:erythromycin esterase
MKYAIFAILIINHIQAIGQSSYASNLKYRSSETVASFDYENELKQIALSSRIVGMGEATHGTAEFEEIKTEVVKTFVTKYNYRHLILEANLVQCRAINDYISSGKGDAVFIMVNYFSWPFSSKHFLAMLDWLKEYNQNKSIQNQVKFYGMDVQGFNALKAMRSELNHQHKISGYEDTILLNKLEGIKGNEKECQKQFKKLYAEYAAKTYDSRIDSLSALITIESQMFINIRFGGKRYKKRESLLFKYIQYHLQALPQNEKVLVWAHNGHVSKNYIERRSLGARLYDFYKDAYKVIGFDFNKGSFRVMTKDSSQRKNIMSILKVKEIPKTVGCLLTNENKGILGLDMKINESHPLVQQSQFINHIGAEYNYTSAHHNQGSFYAEKIKLKRSFNYLFIVNEMHPSIGLTLGKSN